MSYSIEVTEGEGFRCWRIEMLLKSSGTSLFQLHDAPREV